MKTKLLFTLLLVTGFAFGQSTGSVMITEFVPDPSGDESQQEWFEIMNTTGAAIDLNGWTFQDISQVSRTFVVAEELILPANGYLVLANTSDMSLNGGISVDYQYNPLDSGSIFSFENVSNFDDLDTAGCSPNSPDANGVANNELDGLIIFDASMTEIDRLEYDFGYNSANLNPDGSGTPDGLPNLQNLPGWDGSFTMLEGSSCFMSNNEVDNDRSIQKIANTGNVLTDWSYSNGTDVAGVFFGTPGAANGNTLSINEVDALDVLTVYPNPVKSTLTIKTPNQSEISSVEMYNILGSRVLSTSVLINNAIDVSEMTAGIYLLRINIGNNSTTKRVIIE